MNLNVNTIKINKNTEMVHANYITCNIKCKILMLENDHSKECGNFIAKNAQILKGVLSWGDILYLNP